MPESISPVVRRRRLAGELRRLRERSGQTGEEVAGTLGWSPSKISRYESGRTGLRPAEVRKLLDHYGVADPGRAQLLALARDAARKGWWEDYADAIPDEHQAFIGLEAEAASVAQWQVDVVPGLLQTEDYARHVITGYQRVQLTPPGIIERRVRVRMIRQQVLSRNPPLDLTVVLDESVLLRRVGSDPVMRDQLFRLAEAGDLPHITLQVMPLRADRALMVGSFVILGFGSAPESTMQDVVSTEHLKSELYVEGEADTYLHRLAFERLAAESLPPAESRNLIVETARREWS